LENVTTLSGSLTVQINDALSDFSGLDNLTTIEGNVIIGGYSNQGNNSLASLNGLNSLTTINGRLKITNNPMISDISALESVDMSGVTDLDIYDNHNLSFCGLTSICNYIQGQGTYYIEDNATGCDNYSEVYASCNISQFCSNGSLIFNSQSQIDDFLTNNPNCTEVIGDVEIFSTPTSTPITNLDGLAQITSIGGELRISNNTGLTNLAGLSQLTSIGEELTISNNAGLTDLSGLDNLIKYQW